MRLIVFHYHLLPGGVTDVIVHSVRAVCAHVPEITEVRLVAGRRDNAASVVARITGLETPRNAAHSAVTPQTTAGVPVGFDLLAELDYTDPAEPDAAALARADELRRTLVVRYAGDDALRWVHNHHLGKNPSFTRALCEIADLEHAPRMLLHVHDFPECARYENLAYVNRVAGQSPYPASRAVRYAVINERDRRLMVAAGVPESRVGLLLNPLPEADPASQPHEVDRDRVAARLADFAADHGYRFHPEGPILLYPIRAIRRKNALEIATIARLVPGANLVVTLPGVSEPERPYSQLVRYAYEERRIHGLFGIGRRESEYALTYEEIARSADLIVSSSVQEGFGLLFVNALRWRRPLLARRLDVLSGIDSLFEGYPARLYDSFIVPTRSPSVTSMTAYLRMRYGERMEALGDVLPATARERLEDDLDELLGGESIDFSFLPAQIQVAVLGDIRERGFGALVQAMNADVISAVEGLSSQTAPSRDDELERLLGYRAYAHAFSSLLRDEPRGGGSGRIEDAQDSLVEAFARIEQLRLLLGPMDHADH